MTIIIVLALYSYLRFFQTNWLHWFHTALLPLMGNLHSLVEAYIPVDMRHQVHLALSNDVVHQSLLLLFLVAGVQLVLYSFFKALRPLMPAGRAVTFPNSWP